jgi:hypothetical protein
MTAVALISLMQLTDATRAIAAAADANISIVGFAFVNSSVTAQGRRAEPPARNENLSPAQRLPEETDV